jgi:hypothetical protein
MAVPQNRNQQLGEGGAETFKSGGEFLGEDAGFADDGHEVRIARPTGEAVNVQMS